MPRYVQDFLTGFLEAEAEARESDISENAKERHQRAVALRWFGYYKKSNDPNKRFNILRQYNEIATMRERQ